ncbi:MAG: cation transporter [Ignavibacterium sp.]|nr:cation transporter [Ignavibacterium sp.]MDW8376356.1 cation transporter [Ignavibacteriales bacterium]
MKIIKTVFEIPKMDCPSEENLIRVKLNSIEGILKLEFDLVNRKLSVYHSDNLELIEKSILEINLGGKIISSEEIELKEIEEESNQKQILWIVLAINFSFFLIEIITGIISNSMGLVADSLDMLADAFVYGISLYAVGSTIERKKRVATLAGLFQLTLAIIGFVEVIRRFLGLEKIPDFEVMIVVSFFAAIANGICLYLLQKSRSNEAHIKASMIFTSNDVIINIGVIVAGILVLIFNSQIPDLIVGSIVFVLVISGAIRILKLGK